VFSHIYLGNLSPAKVTGYRARRWRNELVVDNFFAEKILFNFKAQEAKSLEKYIFRDFLWISHTSCG